MVLRYMTNIKNSIIFLYTINNNPKTKLRKEFHLQQHQKNKILRNTFTPKMQNLYTENQKTLLK